MTSPRTILSGAAIALVALAAAASPGSGGATGAAPVDACIPVRTTGGTPAWVNLDAYLACRRAARTGTAPAVTLDRVLDRAAT